MDKGYIKLNRKLLENEVCKNPKHLALWIVLLLKASHKETELLWDGGTIKLKPGQFITGRDKLSEATGIKPSSVERILNLFSKRYQIGQQKYNKFRIITIENWERYQGKNEKMDNRMDNRWTTDGQQMDTIKNDKNDKNDKKERGAFAPPSLNEIREYCLIRKNSVDSESFRDFYESKGWFVGKNKMKDWRAAVRTWEARDKGKVASGADVEIPNYAKEYIK